MQTWQFRLHEQTFPSDAAGRKRSCLCFGLQKQDTTTSREFAWIGTLPLNPQLLLKQARDRHSQRELAAKLSVSASTLRKWESGFELPDEIRPELIRIVRNSGQSNEPSPKRTIDLFAGIGGIRMGFESHGYECVFTSEWNKFAEETYKANFGDDHEFVGDIQTFAAEDIPDHEVLLAGFPCQPFSIAGVSKKNSLGRLHGFEDATQGTLFFDVARIIKTKQPKAFMLENVKNLLSHDGGNTFRVILETLRDELGYEVHHRVIDGQAFTPQHRERIVIVGFRESTSFSWDDLDLPKIGPRLGSILHKSDGTEPRIPWDEDRFFDHDSGRVPENFTLTPRLWEYLQNYAAKHKAAGNGFGYGLADAGSITRTLSARYYKDGSEILVDQGVGRIPRRLTPRECARLMGFPDEFRIPVSNTQAYKQFGNSVVMPVMREVARLVDRSLEANVSTPVFHSAQSA